MPGSHYLESKPDEWFLSFGDATTATEAARRLGEAEGRRVDRNSYRQQLVKRGLWDAFSEKIGENRKLYATSEAPGEAPEKQAYKRRSYPDHDVVESRGERIRTLEELLEATAVDLSTWRVEGYTANAWEQHSVKRGTVTMFQVKARLERVRAAVDLAALRDAAVEEMRAHSPAPVRRYKATPKGGLMQEITVPDLHLGALAHAEETGANYDGGIAVAAFRRVFGSLLAHAQNLSVDRIVFPVGNDLLHVDSASDETTNGTRQDTDSRYYRSVRRAIRLMVEALDAMAQVAPVDVVIVPGNHARMQEQMLGEILRAWYRREGDRMTFHDSPAPRKYIRHGANLLGFTHGDGVKASDLPLLMATEAPEMWAQTRHRVWSTGHLHQRKSDHFGSIEEHKGVEVRISPSLKATDSWHAGKGFIGNLRAAEAHVFHEEQGEVARFRAVLPDDLSGAS